jgi:hypothetical protein
LRFVRKIRLAARRSGMSFRNVWGWLLVAFAAAGDARADAPGMPALPVAKDLSTVGIGSWAEYAIVGGGTSSTIRWSVVGRTAEGTTIEISVADTELGKGKRGRVVQQLTVKAGAVKGAAVQIADTDPLAVPAKHELASLDAKLKQGDESVTVKAGTFSAAHYRQTAGLGTFDYWVSDSAGPLGIVKLTLTLPAKTKVIKKRASTTVSVELVAVGNDAKASVVKRPLALDAKNINATRMKLGTAPVTPVLVKKAPVAPVKGN